jgi:cell division transport system permease protein
MTNWFRQHFYALRSAMSHLRASPGNFIFNTLVVAVTLALPITGYTLIDNIRPVATQLSIDPEISIFLNTSASSEEAVAMKEPIQQVLKAANITAKVNYIAKAKALSNMENTSNLAEVLSTLGENPLPDAYILSLPNSDTNKVDALVQQLKGLSQVDVVQVDSAWMKRLAALMNVLQITLIFLAAVLALVVLVVVFNATRLQVLSHHAEIKISRLLGATNGFIQKPYYFAGALLGGLAGCAALGIVALCLIPLNNEIAHFAKLYASEFHLSPLGLIPSLAIIAASKLLGFIGAHISVSRQLAKSPA